MPNLNKNTRRQHREIEIDKQYGIYTVELIKYYKNILIHLFLRTVSYNIGRIYLHYIHSHCH